MNYITDQTVDDGALDEATNFLWFRSDNWIIFPGTFSDDKSVCGD